MRSNLPNKKGMGKREKTRIDLVYQNRKRFLVGTFAVFVIIGTILASVYVLAGWVSELFYGGVAQ